MDSMAEAQKKIRNDFSIRGTGSSIEYSLNGGAWKKDIVLR